jgi:hypothetical protein
MSEKENNEREPLKSDAKKDNDSGRNKKQDRERKQQDKEFRSIEHIGREGLLKEIGEMDGFVSDQVMRGIGDDAAVTDETEQRAGLLTSESFLEGVNFDLTYTPLHHLGYKVVSSTVSDIYAMNGRPTAMLLNIALPNKLSVDMVKQMYQGIYSAGRDYGVQLAGGDLTASHNILTLNATAYGRAEKAKITYRSGAKEGDVLCLTGDLGGATVRPPEQQSTLVQLPRQGGAGRHVRVQPEADPHAPGGELRRPTVGEPVGVHRPVAGEVAEHGAGGASVPHQSGLRAGRSPSAARTRSIQ